DGIRDRNVTGVQTCALPIFHATDGSDRPKLTEMHKTVCVIGAGLAGGIAASMLAARGHSVTLVELGDAPAPLLPRNEVWEPAEEIGRASCRERGEEVGVGGV